ncbi:hypothetical protein ACOMHN_060127 [Nucella lapillus]
MVENRIGAGGRIAVHVMNRHSASRVATPIVILRHESPHQSSFYVTSRHTNRHSASRVATPIVILRHESPHQSSFYVTSRHTTIPD